MFVGMESYDEENKYNSQKSSTTLSSLYGFQINIFTYAELTLFDMVGGVGHVHHCAETN